MKVGTKWWWTIYVWQWCNAMAHINKYAMLENVTTLQIPYNSWDLNSTWQWRLLLLYIFLVMQKSHSNKFISPESQAHCNKLVQIIVLCNTPSGQLAGHLHLLSLLAIHLLAIAAMPHSIVAFSSSKILYMECKSLLASTIWKEFNQLKLIICRPGNYLWGLNSYHNLQM